MPSMVASAFVHIAADMNQLKQQLAHMRGDVGSHLKQIGDDTKKNAGAAMFSAAVAGAQTAMHIIGELKGVLDEWISVAAQSEEIASHFGVTMANMGGKIGFSNDQMSALIDKTQELGSASKRQVTQAADALAQSGAVRGENYVRALALAQDMAAKSGRDLASSAHELSRELVNPEMAIRRLRMEGVQVPPMFGEQIRAMVKAGETAQAQALVMDKLAEVTAGYASAHKQTFQGQFEMMEGKFEEIKTSLGEAFLPALRTIMPLVDTLKSFIDDNKASIQAFGETAVSWLKQTVDWVVGIKEQWDNMDPALRAVLDDLEYAAGQVMYWTSAVGILHAEWLLLEPIIQPIWEWIEKIGASIWKSVGGWEGVHKAAIGFDTAVHNIGLSLQLAFVQWEVWLSEFWDSFGEMGRPVRAFLMTMIAEVAAGFRTLAADAKAAVAGDWDDVKNPFEEMVKAGDKAYRDVMSHAAGTETAALKGELKRLNAEFMQKVQETEERLKRKPQAAGKKGGDVGGGDPEAQTGGGGKLAFEGFESLYKKISEAVSGGSLVSLTKQLVDQGKESNKNTAAAAANLSALLNKNNQAVVAPG